MWISKHRGLDVSLHRLQPVAGGRPDPVANRLILLLFMLIPIEGILRKWIVPGMHGFFYFTRDPFVVSLYLWYWLVSRRRLTVPYGTGVNFVLVTLVGMVITAALQVRFGIVSPVVAGIGLRSYLLYMPLAYIVWKSMDGIAFARLLKLVVILSITLAPLSVAQFYARDGILNVGAGGAPPMGLALGFFRTTGFMAAVAHNADFLGFCTALLLAALVAGVQTVNRWWMVVGLVATAISIAVSGARMAWFLAAIVLVFALAASLLTSLRRPTTAVRLYAALAVLVVGIGGAYYAFPEAAEAFRQRNENARTFSEATIERIKGMIMPDPDFLDEPLGHGIGASTTAGGYLQRGERKFTLAENDWDRNIAELGPVIGGWFIAFRVLVAAWLVWCGFRAALWGYPGALVLAGYAGTSIAVAQITQHTVHAHLAWLAGGLVLALAGRPALLLGVGRYHAGRDVIGRMTGGHDRRAPVPCRK